MTLNPSRAEPDVALALPARPENVAVVRQAVGGIAEALEVDAALAADMKIAVTEACTNAVLHAYEEDEEGGLEVALRVTDNRVTISVRDRGPGFKPLPAEHAEGPLGFGLALIASLADAFAIEGGSRGTEVRMAFLLDLADAGESTQPPDGGVLDSIRPAPAPGRVELRLAAGPLMGPVLGRVVSLLAARADFSIDRLSDAQIVCDALAQHAPEQATNGAVVVTIAQGERLLDLAVGPLAPGGGQALLAASELPGLGRLLDQLAREVTVEPEPQGELLRLELG